jgi:hypothetical protein
MLFNPIEVSMALVEMRSSLILRFDTPSITLRHTVWKEFKIRSISAVTDQLSHP